MARYSTWFDVFYYGNKYKCCKCGGSIFTMETLPPETAVCDSCVKKEQRQKWLEENGIALCNGKLTDPFLPIEAAAHDFDVPTDGFRKLYRDGKIPGEQKSKYKFIVNMSELNDLVKENPNFFQEAFSYHDKKEKLKTIAKTIEANGGCDDWEKEYKRLWYQLNKEEVLQQQKERRAENPKAHAESQAKWRKANKDKVNEQVRNRKENDPIYKLKCQARCTIYQSFARRGKVKNSRCESVTGTSIDNLVSHLLQTYTDIYGRTWDGKEAVHIDHIIPISTAETEEDVIRLCHYTNLQLLKAEDNMAKSNKLNYQIGGN